MNLFTSSNSSTTTPVIDAPPTRFTSQAGYSAAIAAVLAGALAVLQGLDVLAITEPVKIALIGLVGAGILAWAIAAAGDSLARAYAVAHVTRTAADETNQPAIQTAAFRLADVYATAHGLKPATLANTTGSGPSAATTSAYMPSSTTASKECCLELSPPLKVQVRGKDAQATAILISGESGKETQRYLVGSPGGQLVWMNSDAISLPDAAPPPTPIHAMPADNKPSSATTTQECCLEFSPPLEVKWQGKEGKAIAVRITNEGGKDIQRYLVGTQGKPYVWVDEAEVIMH